MNFILHSDPFLFRMQSRLAVLGFARGEKKNDADVEGVKILSGRGKRNL